MKCRSCGGESYVIRVNPPPDPPPGNVVRVRSCKGCGMRWRTVEARASEADFVEAFKYLMSKRPA